MEFRSKALSYFNAEPCTGSQHPHHSPHNPGLGLVMAITGLSGHVASTSALPPTADLRVSMSAFAPISSASPPGADLPGGVAEGPLLTHSRRRCQVGPLLSDSGRPIPIVPTTHPQEKATGAPFQRGHVAPNRPAARRRRPQGVTANVYSGLLAARKVPE